MTMHSAGDFVVYPCEACGKRIFTERSHVGTTGACPLCNQQHLIGGRAVVAAEPGIERRDAARVPAPKAKVALDAKAPGGAAFETVTPSLHAVADLSETGVGIRLPGVKDPKHLSGVRPPDVKVGDVLRIALHTPELFRPRAFKATVRRVVPSKDKKTFVIGLSFEGLTEEQKAELRALVRRLGGETHE
jgi:DNA-directed RNA polymerase subunit RPC12/RpoP